MHSISHPVQVLVPNLFPHPHKLMCLPELADLHYTHNTVYFFRAFLVDFVHLVLDAFCHNLQFFAHAFGPSLAHAVFVAPVFFVG